MALTRATLPGPSDQLRLDSNDFIDGEHAQLVRAHVQERERSLSAIQARVAAARTMIEHLQSATRLAIHKIEQEIVDAAKRDV